LKGAGGRKIDDGEPNAAGGKDLGDVKVKTTRRIRTNEGKKKRGNGRLKEREGEKRWGEGDEVLIAVKSGGAPSLRPSPKRHVRLNRRRISSSPLKCRLGVLLT
jgi:hypothetical protein